MYPYLTDKVILVGKIEEQLIPSISAAATSIPLPSSVTVNPTTTWATSLPRDFTIQDGVSVERVTISGITGSSGSYAATCSALVNSYNAPLASILTPGVAQTLTSADFNCRMRNVKVAPKIDPDGESEKFQTGDHGRDQSIMGAQSGTISFSEKVAVNLSAGTGAEVDITAAAGVITAVTATPTSGHAGTGYVAGDLLNVGGAGLGAVIQVASVVAGTGAVSAFSTSPIAGGAGYTTGTGNVTSNNVTPVWAKFMRGCGHFVKTYTTKGIGFQPLASTDDVTMTIGVIQIQGGAAPKGLMMLFSGCKGDGSIGAEGIGKPYTFQATFTGKYVSQTDVTNANLLTLTLPETALPEKMLSNVVQTTVLSTSTILPVQISKWNLAFGNKTDFIDNQADATGYYFWERTSQDPKITLDPLLLQVSQEDLKNNIQNEQLVDIQIESALTAPHITIEVPNAQLMSPSYDARNNQVATSRTYRALRNNLGSGAAQSAIPDECMYEILIGSRV
jgi:hypothetical protein